MKTDSTVADFWGTDNNGKPEYQVFYLGVFDPVLTPPYCIFRRYKRERDADLQSRDRQYVNDYYFEIYHTVAWSLLDLQQRLRSLLDSLPLTIVGGIFVQQLEVKDDYHILPPEHLEAKLRLYKGVLDFQMVYNPD